MDMTNNTEMIANAVRENVRNAGAKAGWTADIDAVIAERNLVRIKFAKRAKGECSVGISVAVEVTDGMDAQGFMTALKDATQETARYASREIYQDLLDAIA